MIRNFGGDLVQELLEQDGPVPTVDAGDDGASWVLNAANKLVVPWRT